METILVTGLDGSGKSTFFSRLAAAKPAHVGILSVPHIDLAQLDSQQPVYRTAKFINELSAASDHGKEPRLKAMAIFSSMLLFRELVKAHVTPQITHLFFERHPLIDTGIYAKFYAEKMDPALLSPALLDALDANYSTELDHLLSLLPLSVSLSVKTRSGKLAQFIYQWFHVDKKDSVAELGNLFALPLPHKIYFLDASPETLYSRISGRERKEAHESQAVLAQLSPVYKLLLEKIKTSAACEVHTVNAGQLDQLDRFFETVLQHVNA